MRKHLSISNVSHLFLQRQLFPASGYRFYETNGRKKVSKVTIKWDERNYFHIKTKKRDRRVFHKVIIEPSGKCLSNVNSPENRGQSSTD